MAKKHFQRALSVGLSLALCAGMVAPGFAATFGELQGAIDSGNSVLRGESIDESKSDAENYKIKVEAGKDGEGKDTRIVTLYEDVKAEKGESGIVIGGEGKDAAAKNITLDLNGNDIDLNPGWELALNPDPEKGTSAPEYYEETNGSGKVNSTDTSLNQDDVIHVAEDSKLTLEDTGATWEDPSSDPSSSVTPIPEYVGGRVTGGTYHAGINNEGTLVMNGGEISGNTYDSAGGVKNRGNFEMNGGVIRNNVTAVSNSGDFTMNGGQISENVGTRGTVLFSSNGRFLMNGGRIAGNKSAEPALDIYSSSTGESPVKIHGGTIIGNQVAWWDDSHMKGQKNLWALSNLGTVTLPADSEPVSPSMEDGSVDFPAGTRIEKGNTESVGVDYIHVDKNGNMTGQFVSKTENSDKSVTITDTKNGTHDVTVPEGGSVTLDGKGNTTISGGGSIEGKDGEDNKTVTTYPDGATIDKNGNITGEGVTKTEKDNSVEVDKGGDDNFTVNPPKSGDDGEKVTINQDGSVDIPNGGTKDDDKTETTYPNGGKINPDGTVEGEGTTVTKDKETGDVTIDDGKGGKTEVTVPDDKKDDVDVDSEGKTHVPGGSEQPVEMKKDGEDEGTKITAPEGTDIVVNPDGSVDVPAGGKVTDKDGNEYELPEGGKITEDGKVVDKDGNPVEPKKDDNGSGGSQGGGNGVTGGNGEADVIVIDGVEVPLSGLVSVEDVLDVLYRLAEGVDGERDEVVAWAVENGIIDDETDVEELVTVAALRAILANYARAFELDVDVTTLATLTGEDDDIVMNCDEVIDEFFTKAEEDEAA